MMDHSYISHWLEPCSSIINMIGHRQGFRIAPRIGQLECIKRVYVYVSQFKYAAIRFRTNTPDYSSLPDFSSLPEQNFDLMSSVYGGSREPIPHDIPKPLGKPVRITHNVDASLFHDVKTGRYVTGIVDFLNKTPIDWFSEKQATVETATWFWVRCKLHMCWER